SIRPARSPVEVISHPPASKWKRLSIAAGLTACAAVAGCQTNHSRNVPTRAPVGAAPTSPSDSISSQTMKERPLAMLEGQPIGISTMQARLIEQSGAETLRELRLEAALRRTLLEADLSVGKADTAHEEAMLLERFSSDEDTARMVLQTLRRNEGLGPERYAALLWRNAALRILVQEEIELTPDTLQRLYQLEHGPRMIIRIMVVATLQEAEELHGRLVGGEDFEDLAARRSIDASRDRGGLLDPISPEDPTWPQALRSEIVDLQPGELSGIVFFDDRFAIARMERSLPADEVPFETVRDEIELAAQLSQERLRMAELAGRLGVQPKIKVLDPVLRRAWSVDEAAEEQQ
ncbi:MAG: peptidylprolyl isomerase, partial [Phycisphaerales bacterium]|nr:peptidylprolyl isomerase [Phycisphaerales bacterium]